MSELGIRHLRQLEQEGFLAEFNLACSVVAFQAISSIQIPRETYEFAHGFYLRHRAGEVLNGMVLWNRITNELGLCRIDMAEDGLELSLGELSDRINSGYRVLGDAMSPGHTIAVMPYSAKVNDVKGQLDFGFRVVTLNRHGVIEDYMLSSMIDSLVSDSGVWLRVFPPEK